MIMIEFKKTPPLFSSKKYSSKYFYDAIFFSANSMQTMQCYFFFEEKMRIRYVCLFECYIL